MNRTILIVDDDPFYVRHVAQRIHDETALRTLVCEDLDWAVSMINDPGLRLDAMLADVGFPASSMHSVHGLKDGLELISLAQRSRPAMLNYVFSVMTKSPEVRRKSEKLKLKVRRWFDKLAWASVRQIPPWVLIEKDLSVRRTLVSPPRSKSKSDGKDFDVFLAHNSKDKREIETLAKRLVDLGVTPWFDAWNIPPGRLFQEEIEKAIPRIRAAAVLIGKSGLGPWEKLEMRLAISEFMRRKLPVIPVVLPKVKRVPRLPLFLKEFSWVRFKDSLDDSKGMSALLWGITVGTSGLQETRGGP